MRQLQEHIKDIIKNGATPFYYYDMGLLHNTLRSLCNESRALGYHIHYAMKANANEEILKVMKEYNLGIDCVSGNEIKKSLQLGFESKQVVFAGVGKTDDELELAIDQDIFSINCESFEEIEVINKIAKAKGKTANIAIRINPNVDASTHKHITTGKEENKFGINASELIDVVALVARLEHVKIIGLHFHIGSQITSYQPYIELCKAASVLIQQAIDLDVELQHVNLGGGLGIDYERPDENPIADFHSFFRMINEHLDVPDHVEVHFELGRSIVGQCGSLVTKVLYNKPGSTKNFLIVDAGMTELLRPALYDAYHKVETLHQVTETEIYDVVGPICESTDSFATNILLPISKRGDILIIRSVGAYGEVMALNYNLREKPKSYYANKELLERA